MIKLVCCLIFINSVVNSQVVELPNGNILGRLALSSNGAQFFSYQEIPYAEPPIGVLRFQAPVPKGSWSGILKTQNNTKMCYQVPVDNELENEDCLYLNVYTPEAPGSTKRLPVLFFIHGGGFVEGSGTFDTYGPQRWMDYGIVVVTINYRLGPFGFLSTNDSVIPGNNGLRDQNLALKWVQSNIHLFGGDPTKVTIYGQSAGAASVCYHLLSKKSEGLFRAAILSSGSCLSPWSYQRKAKDYAYQLSTNITPLSPILSSDMLKLFLLSMPADIIDSASKNIHEDTSNEQMVQGFFFGPVIEEENEDAFITQRMYESFLAGNFNKVPTFLGINSEEAVYRLIDPTSLYLRIREYEENIENLVTNDFHIPDIETRREAAEEIRKIYTDGKLQDNLYQTVQYFSDVSFTKPVIKTAELISNYIEVYFYQFSYPLKIFGFSLEVGVYHGGEVPFLWDFAIGLYNEDNLQASKRFLTLYTNFVKTLDPTPNLDPVLQNLKLEKVKPGFFPYIDVNSQLTIQESPKNETFQKWEKVYEKYGVRPFDTY